MNEKTIVAVDAMGGDNAPGEIVKGAGEERNVEGLGSCLNDGWERESVQGQQ